jgi:hypothetical protein
MGEIFDFHYKCVVIKRAGVISVVGYNSPYNQRQDKQSVDDILFAIHEGKIIDADSLQEEVGISLQFLCRFIPNDDGTYSQIFELEKVKELAA